MSNLGQCGLKGAVQGPGLHMLWYQALLSEDMQGHPLSGWAQVLVDHLVSLCTRNKRHKMQEIRSGSVSQQAAYLHSHI